MEYSNSSLVSYTKISPNRTAPRNHKIDTITIHCYVGQVTVERIGKGFADPNRRASCNYGVAKDGKIALICPESDRSWCSSSSANDHRAITIEVASDSIHPYAVTDAAYKSLIDLLVDICKRNNIPKLLWKADKNLIGQIDKQNMTVHRWFAAKSCPGEWLYTRHNQIAEEVNKRLGSSEQTETETNMEITLPVLRKGAKGEQVKAVQAMLVGLSIKDNSNNVLEVDGSFGNKTRQAVINFQKSIGLTASGEVDKKTYQSLLGA